jgi:hypothetical protein
MMPKRSKTPNDQEMNDAGPDDKGTVDSRMLLLDDDEIDTAIGDCRATIKVRDQRQSG